MFVREATTTVQLIKAWFSSDTRQNISQQQTNAASLASLHLWLFCLYNGNGRTQTQSPNKQVLYPQSVAFQWEDNTFPILQTKESQIKNLLTWVGFI